MLMGNVSKELAAAGAIPGICGSFPCFENVGLAFSKGLITGQTMPVKANLACKFGTPE